MSDATLALKWYFRNGELARFTGSKDHEELCFHKLLALSTLDHIRFPVLLNWPPLRTLLTTTKLFLSCHPRSMPLFSKLLTFTLQSWRILARFWLLQGLCGTIYSSKIVSSSLSDRGQTQFSWSYLTQNSSNFPLLRMLEFVWRLLKLNQRCCHVCKSLQSHQATTLTIIIKS
jgi:hypothetical protein